MDNELQPASDIDKTLAIGDEFVSQVRTFGALGYSINRICQLLNLRGKKKLALQLRMKIPGDIYYDAYNSGQALGEYNIDAELAKRAETGDIDSITLLEQRKNERKELDMRKELFGV